jgi:hypothetical protein
MLIKQTLLVIWLCAIAIQNADAQGKAQARRMRLCFKSPAQGALGLGSSEADIEIICIKNQP